MRGCTKCRADGTGKACARKVTTGCFKEDFLEEVMLELGASWMKRRSEQSRLRMEHRESCRSLT